MEKSPLIRIIQRLYTHQYTHTHHSYDTESHLTWIKLTLWNRQQMLQSYEISSCPNWVEHTHIPSQTRTHSMAWQTHPAPLVMPAALSKLIRERASSQPFTQLIVFHRAVSPNQTEHHFSGKTTEDSSLQLSQPITDSSEHTTPVANNVTHTTTVASFC